MKIRGVNEQDLIRALERTNEKFGNNVQFNRFMRDHYASGRELFAVTLRVKSSSGPGARRGVWGGKKMVAACWHVWLAFLTYLPEGAQTYSREDGSRNAKLVWRSAHDEPADWNIGNMYRPEMLSEACDCTGL